MKETPTRASGHPFFRDRQNGRGELPDAVPGVQPEKEQEIERLQHHF